MSEWLKETDCKSVTVMLRWFESNSAQYIIITISSIELVLECFNYIPTIFLRIRYNSPITTKIKTIKMPRNLGILNKFRNGVRIINANPITLLIKNLG